MTSGRHSTEPRTEPTYDVKCGTNKGYGRHVRLGEKACADCLDAHNEYQAGYVDPMDRIVPLAGPAISTEPRPTMPEIMAAHIIDKHMIIGDDMHVRCRCTAITWIGAIDPAGGMYTIAGEKHTAHVITELAKHGYGDHADAIEQAGRECPIRPNNHVSAEAVKSWLHGRAALMRGTI